MKIDISCVRLPARFSVTLICTVLFAATASGQASGDCDWLGGTDSNWHTAANWDCSNHDGVPTADDAVTIAPGGVVEVLLAADAQAWSLEIGVDDGSSSHSENHRLRTTVDDVTLSVGDGGVSVRQSGYMVLGQNEVSGGIGSQPPLRANLESIGSVLVHGKFDPRNATIDADITLDRPSVGGIRGRMQARGWNVINGQLHVVDGFLQPVVPGGFYDTGAAHLRVVGNDLIVEAGSSVQLFADPGPITEAAIAVDGGVFDLRGSLATSSFSSSANMPIEIDAALVNTGVIRSRLARPVGLAFSGPDGVQHENAGTIAIGALFGSDTEGDAVDGFGLLIEPGRILDNTGEVIIHRLRSAEGEVANTGGGTVTDVTEVSGTGSHVLGFSGSQSVAIEIVDPGSIERLHMTWHGQDHPDAGLNANIAGTSHWWDLAATTADDNPASGNLALSLPRLNPNVPRVCRYQESPPDWVCLPTAVDTQQATVGGLTELSAWAVADLLDLLFSDRFEGP